MILRRARMFILSESSNACVDPLDIIADRIFTRPSSPCCQILRSVEEYDRRWCESTCALEPAGFGFSVIVLYCTRMFTCWFAHYHIPKPDHSVVSLHRNATSNANQHAKPEVRKGHPHLGDHCGCGAVAWLMESRDNHIVT